MAMHADLFGLQSNRLAAFSRPFSGRAGGRAAEALRSHLGWLSAILIAGLGVSIMFSGANRGSQPVAKADIVPIIAYQPAQSADPAHSAVPFDSAAAPEEAAALDGLKISSQSWRRGGLGSKALVTFTLRNDNDYAVGDIGLLCSFSRADGSPVTERRQTIRDTVKMKSRRTFTRVHVGFINVNANRAKCTLLSASRV
jgi:hypothetical protein